MSIEVAMKQYGPRLCHILVRQIGGEAARSELDVFAEPLKRLVVAQLHAKQWLASALDSDGFPSKKIGPTEKRMWLQRIIKYVQLSFVKAAHADLGTQSAGSQRNEPSSQRFLDCMSRSRVRLRIVSRLWIGHICFMRHDSTAMD